MIGPGEVALLPSKELTGGRAEGERERRGNKRSGAMVAEEEWVGEAESWNGGRQVFKHLR